MKRLSIRILVGLSLCVALVACAAVPIPEDANAHQVLPAFALDQVSVYRLEVALMVFYGGLLLVTPAYSGLVEGRMPIEISARGARFAERADHTAESSAEALQTLEQTTAELSEELSDATLEITLLKRAIDDKRKPPVPSKR
ncbi:MAG TPA: hypothetical protein VFP17_08975 [Solirubrobacterales bacterium]|nr:hypothetical protein [Solirubrobacterales bacterium]